MFHGKNLLQEKFVPLFYHMQICAKHKILYSYIYALQRSFTSSSQVFLWAGDGGIQTWPLSRELSMARRRARDKSCLARWFLEFQLKVDGDSDPVASIT